MIAKDLLSGDSAKALLKLTEEQLDSTIRKTYYQDSIIGVHIQKEENFNTIIGFERDKFSTLKIYTDKLELDLKKERVKTKLFRWGTGGLLLSFGVIAFMLK
jgi:hypothetical protein